MTLPASPICPLPTDLGQHAGDALIAIDASRRLLRMNPMAERLLGLQQDRAIGRHCAEVLGSSLCQADCPLSRILAGEDSVTDFNVELKPAGRPTPPVCIVSSPLRDGSGAIVGIVESIRDVRHVVRLMEEREEAVARARHAAAWLEAIVDTVNDAVIACDADLRITGFNRMAEALTGFRRDEVIGRSCKDTLARGFCPLEETISGAAGLPGMQLTLTSKDGREVPVWLTTELLRDSAGVVVGAVQFLRSRATLVPGANAYGALAGQSPAMRRVYRSLDQLTHSDSTVLIQGESGTGKELAAEVLHARSDRRNKPFIRVNCAALPETLLESELFGHVRGAFTGAVQDRPGRFELAHRGTLFLDEIGDLPHNMQAKLLRVLQERSVERLGSGRPVPLDIRVIAATNRDLPAMLRAGTFREDLYYRLAVVPLTMPPLRDHREDIEELAARFLLKLAARRKHPSPTLGPGVLEALTAHSWPGNVRELENALEFAAVHCPGDRIDVAHLPPSVTPSGSILPPTPDASEPQRLAAALRSSQSAAEAAQRLGISRATLFRRLKQHGLSAAPGKSQ